MKLREQTSQTLRYEGVPGGAGWMIGALVLGVVILAVSLTVMGGSIISGAIFIAMWTGIGALIGVGLIWLGADRLLRRELLSLDRGRGEGVYAVRSFFGLNSAIIRFRLDDVDHVRLSRTVEETPHTGPDSSPGAVSSIAWRAELLVAEPRERIPIAESQNDNEAPVREAATLVASFLEKSLVEEIDGAEELIEADEVDAPLADRGGPGIPTLDPQPDGSRIELTIDESALSVTLRWKAMGSGCLVFIGLAIMGLWTAVSLVFLLGMLGVIPGGAAAPGQKGAVLISVDIAFVLIGVAGLAALVAVLRGHRTVVITPEHVVVRAPLGVGAARLPTREVKSVRKLKSDDAIIASAGEKRARIGLHLPAEGELTWLSKAIRVSVKSLGR